MAKSSRNEVARTEPIDVTDLRRALALLAAWRGAYHFFGARVENWEVTSPTSENPDGGLVIHGLTMNGDLNSNQVLDDLSRRERRVDFLPAYQTIVNGVEPQDFTDPQDITNFSVSMMIKGSGEDGTTKTPEYVRNSISNYKAAHGLATRRGPRRKIIRLDNLDELDEATISQIDPEQLAAFLAKAQNVAASQTQTVESTS